MGWSFIKHTQFDSKDPTFFYVDGVIKTFSPSRDMISLDFDDCVLIMLT